MTCTDFNLDTLVLRHGAHGSDYRGACCLVEAANRATVCIPALGAKYGKADQFNDDHPSISPVIRSFCISWNDGIRDDEERTRLLKPYVTKILGTKTTPEDEETRAWMATDWLVRVHMPAWLDRAGLTTEAAQVRALPPLTSAEIALASQRVIEHARDRADAAMDAAWDAARAAARAAARDAARDAAWDAARAAAMDAAGAAAMDAAGDAARAAARAAAWAAARDAVHPIVEQLQVSALDLLDRMIAVGAAPAEESGRE